MDVASVLSGLFATTAPKQRVFPCIRFKHLTDRQKHCDAMAPSVRVSCLLLLILVPMTTGQYQFGTRPQADNLVMMMSGLPFVIGGTQVSPNEYPYLVLMLIRTSTGNFRKWCGASVLDTNHVLTAAHCVTGDRDFWIVAGEHDITRTSGNEQFIQVQNVIIHPNYNRGQLLNDVAVLRLREPLQIVPGIVEPVTLNSQPTCPPESLQCTLTGWGRTTEGPGSVSSNIPLKVNLGVMSNQQCSQFYTRTIGIENVCAGGVQGKGGCNGDSGGPLMCQCGSGPRVQAGIVSFGVRGCLTVYPTVFARVSTYISWIQQVIQGQGQGVEGEVEPAEMSVLLPL